VANRTASDTMPTFNSRLNFYKTCCCLPNKESTEEYLLFTDLFLHDELLKALDKLGFDKMTPVQEQAIPPAMDERDLLVNAETGSGKTIAFLLPILHQLLSRRVSNGNTRALILTPTRELARQILKHCNDLLCFTNLKADVVTGGADYNYQKALFKRNPEIVIATPGRLLELLDDGMADMGDLEVLVLDEADRMLDMGFSETVLSIVSLCLPSCQKLLYSATLNHQGIKSVADEILNDPLEITINTHQDKHSAIKQQMLLSDDYDHKLKQLTWLLEHEETDKSLIFTNTRKLADQLGRYLTAQGKSAEVLHGEMAQLDRNKVMDRIRRGHIDTLVATDVAARGLDIKGINLVINFDMPRSGDAYVHRIGRTGRGGSQGLAISLVDHMEWNLMASIERYLHQKLERRKIKELLGSYKGPKKVKASGRAAGPKKKKKNQSALKAKKKPSHKKQAGKRKSTPD